MTKNEAVHLQFGQQLCPSQLAIRRGVLKSSDSGVFLRLTKTGLGLYIVKAGNVTVQTWSINFWTALS